MIVMHVEFQASLMVFNLRSFHVKDLLKEKESTNGPKDQGDIDYLRSLE